MGRSFSGRVAPGGIRAKPATILTRASLQSALLVLFGKIDPGFLGGVRGGSQLYFFELPQASDAGAGAIGGGEEYVGIQKEPIHSHALDLRGLRREILEGLTPSFLASARAAS